MPYKDLDKRLAANAKWKKDHPEQHLASVKKWRLENQEKVRATKAIWRSKNPEKIRDNSRKSRYKLSVEQLTRVNNATHCECCNRYFAVRGYGRKVVDHDHISGKFRGVICLGCNVLLGGARDSTENLYKAINYLRGILNA